MIGVAEAGQSAFLEKVLDYLEDYVAVWNLDGEFVYVNRQLRQLWQLDPADYLGRPLGEMGFQVSNVAVLEKAMREVIRGERSVRGRFPYRKGASSEGYCEFILNPLCNARGEVEYVICVARDVSLQKAAEDAMQISERRFRLLFEAMSQGVTLIELLPGDHGNIEDALVLKSNPAFARLIGLRDTEGHRVSDVHPEALRRSAETWRRVAQTGKPERYVAASPDGARRLTAQVLPVEGQDWQVALLVDDLKPQEDLRESEERYEALAELCPDAMLVCQDERLAYANPAAAQLLGASRDIVGTSAYDYIAPESQATIKERLRQLLGGGSGPVKDEFRMKRLDGSMVDVEVAAASIKWSGQPAMQMVARDITARKRGERELASADRRKDEFLATLAHELRNPMAPIQTGIEVLRLSQGDEDALEDTLDMMGRQMSHLISLVDDLLDISRISRGKVQLRRSAVDVRDAVSRALEASSPFIHAGRRQVAVRLPPHALVVEADPVRLVQVISNLLSNAGKYTEDEGHIWVDVYEEGDQVRIKVRDDGIGVAPQAQPLLFEMFMQVDAHRVGGLGIGLSLVKKLVELHGGTVQVFSEGLGKGAEFCITLPLIAERLPEESPARRHGLPSLAGLRTLVVDDNHDAATSLSALFGLLGAKCRSAHCGQSALACYTDFHPHLVLLDLGLPDMDGYTVARAIRKLEGKGPRARVVAVTGWGQDEDRQRSEQAGFDAHLVKPIDLQEIVAMLEAQALGEPSANS